MKRILIAAAVACMLVLLVLGVRIAGNLYGDGTGDFTVSSFVQAANVTLANALATDDSDSGTANGLTTTEGSALDVTEMFTQRDLEQTANLDEAEYIELASGEDVLIDQEGVYVVSGSADDVTIQVDAGEDAKVQIVLNGVSIQNADTPAIYVASADKVFVTLADGENTLEVSGSFATASMDSVILSKSDLTLNGTGSLTIVSGNGNGITSKDDLKITGGTYQITAAIDGLKANDSIRINGGQISINAQKDALHSENDDDASLGYIYIDNATMEISAADDGIQGNAIVQIDGGVIDITTSREGIEGTYVQINGGEITIYAMDDGINAAQKSSYDVVMEINGGMITISMASGDTDAMDSNGNLYINGGTINITANSAFDYNGTGILTGGDITVNGSTVTELTQSQMGGGGRGGNRDGFNGQPGKWGTNGF